MRCSMGSSNRYQSRVIADEARLVQRRPPCYLFWCTPRTIDRASRGGLAAAAVPRARRCSRAVAQCAPGPHDLFVGRHAPRRDRRAHPRHFPTPLPREEGAQRPSGVDLEWIVALSDGPTNFLQGADLAPRVLLPPREPVAASPQPLQASSTAAAAAAPGATRRPRSIGDPGKPGAAAVTARRASTASSPRLSFVPTPPSTLPGAFLRGLPGGARGAARGAAASTSPTLRRVYDGFFEFRLSLDNRRRVLLIEEAGCRVRDLGGRATRQRQLVAAAMRRRDLHVAMPARRRGAAAAVARGGRWRDHSSLLEVQASRHPAAPAPVLYRRHFWLSGAPRRW